MTVSSPEGRWVNVVHDLPPQLPSYFPIRRFSLPLGILSVMLNPWYWSVVLDVFSAPSRT